jgi:plastocyanin
MRATKPPKENTVIFRGLAFFLLILAVSVCVHAEEVEGTITVKKKLTKRRVTAAVRLYERGPAVELGTDAETDPLAFERARVAVYIEGRNESRNADASVVAKIDQTNRRFSPETLVIQAGTKVSFPNLDPIFHNVLSNPKMFDLGNYPQGETRWVTFAEPGIVQVHCHLHPNMAATIVVAPNKWNTKVDRDGRFVLHDVPPGMYTIVAWHKAAGFFRQQIRVTAGKNESVEFLIPIDDDAGKGESRAPKPKR